MRFRLFKLLFPKQYEELIELREAYNRLCYISHVRKMQNIQNEMAFNIFNGEHSHPQEANIGGLDAWVQHELQGKR